MKELIQLKVPSCKVIISTSIKRHDSKKASIAANDVVQQLQLTATVNTIGLSFNKHISKLCSKAAMQLNAICRLAKFMGSKEKIAMINSFVYSNFNYCPLVWHFCTCESSQKMEKIKKCCLRLVLYDSKSDYGHLIQKNGTTTMEIKKLRTSVTELFKTISNINPSYMKNMFTLKKKKKI